MTDRDRERRAKVILSGDLNLELSYLDTFKPKIPGNLTMEEMQKELIDKLGKGDVILRNKHSLRMILK